MSILSTEGAAASLGLCIAAAGISYLMKTDGDKTGNTANERDIANNKTSKKTGPKAAKLDNNNNSNNDSNEAQEVFPILSEAERVKIEMELLGGVSLEQVSGANKAKAKKARRTAAAAAKRMESLESLDVLDAAVVVANTPEPVEPEVDLEPVLVPVSSPGPMHAQVSKKKKKKRSSPRARSISQQQTDNESQFTAEHSEPAQQQQKQQPRSAPSQSADNDTVSVDADDTFVHIDADMATSHSDMQQTTIDALSEEMVALKSALQQSRQEAASAKQLLDANVAAQAILKRNHDTLSQTNRALASYAQEATAKHDAAVKDLQAVQRQYQMLQQSVALPTATTTNGTLQSSKSVSPQPQQALVQSPSPLQKEISSLRESLSSKTSEISRLNALMHGLREQNSELRSSAAKDVEMLKHVHSETLESVRASLEAALHDVRRELIDSRKAHIAELAELKKLHAAEKEKAREQAAATVSQVSKEVEANLVQSIEAKLQAQHADEVSKLKQEFLNEIDAIKVTQFKSSKDSEGIYLMNLEALKTTHKAEVEKLNKQIDEIKISQFKSSKDSEGIYLMNLEALKNNHKSDLEKQKKQLEELKQAHLKSTKDAEAVHWNSLRTLSTTHASDIEALKAGHIKQLEELKVKVSPKDTPVADSAHVQQLEQEVKALKVAAAEAATLRGVLGEKESTLSLVKKQLGEFEASLSALKLAAANASAVTSEAPSSKAESTTDAAQLYESLTGQQSVIASLSGALEDAKLASAIPAHKPVHRQVSAAESLSAPRPGSPVNELVSFYEVIATKEGGASASVAARKSTESLVVAGLQLRIKQLEADLVKAKEAAVSVANASAAAAVRFAEGEAKKVKPVKSVGEKVDVVAVGGGVAEKQVKLPVSASCTADSVAPDVSAFEVAAAHQMLWKVNAYDVEAAWIASNPPAKPPAPQQEQKTSTASPAKAAEVTPTQQKSTASTAKAVEVIPAPASKPSLPIESAYTLDAGVSSEVARFEVEAALKSVYLRDLSSIQDSYLLLSSGLAPAAVANKAVASNDFFNQASVTAAQFASSSIIASEVAAAVNVSKPTVQKTVSKTDVAPTKAVNEGAFFSLASQAANEFAFKNVIAAEVAAAVNAAKGHVGALVEGRVAAGAVTAATLVSLPKQQQQQQQTSTPPAVKSAQYELETCSAVQAAEVETAQKLAAKYAGRQAEVLHVLSQQKSPVSSNVDAPVAQKTAPTTSAAGMYSAKPVYTETPAFPSSSGLMYEVKPFYAGANASVENVSAAPVFLAFADAKPSASVIAYEVQIGLKSMAAQGYSVDLNAHSLVVVDRAVEAAAVVAVPVVSPVAQNVPSVFTYSDFTPSASVIAYEVAWGLKAMARAGYTIPVSDEAKTPSSPVKPLALKGGKTPAQPVVSHVAAAAAAAVSQFKVVADASGKACQGLATADDGRNVEIASAAAAMLMSYANQIEAANV
ncbi:hypothetical protein CcCBS67573_g07628 [Chytriomyces confervae]|uniref:Uncharacterized protein n=1 Tax=Chytriomyces confervae TaxID=246404 RepID=A0A507ERZ8_9FUNG|nr:hypothetical protein CcCBS67573_g07628 [Chytriomyces confervae]